MDIISYKFIKEGNVTDLTSDKYEVIINEKTTGVYFNEPGLVVSAEQDGVFPMFAGVCGMVGCCGLYVETKISKDIVTWEKFWDGQSCGQPNPEDEVKEFNFTKNFSIKPPMVFNREEYQKLATVFMTNKQNWFLETIKRYREGERFSP
ncbi:MAG: hypothetical protein KAZ30_02085 [Candidatus Magasanikbacteria bacterium]|nr:hypothetical protein [Candidatus Magasanikbacteria bacterium]